MFIKWFSNFSNLCYGLSYNVTMGHYCEDKCQEQGGHAVSIHSQEENDFILSAFGSALSDVMVTWIGAVDRGSWSWEDGTDWDYSNWGLSK